MGYEHAIILKLLLTFVLTLFYGIFKQFQNKPIGFGTYSYVAVGSCALSYTAMKIGGSNPMTLIGAIMTGIGFLGAGALLKSDSKVTGFTSAAGVWLTAILGINIGLGEYGVGFTLYVFIWLIIIIDFFLAREKVGMYQRKVFLETNEMLSQEAILKLFGIKKYREIMRVINNEQKLFQIEFVAKIKEDKLIEIEKEILNSAVINRMQYYDQ